MREIKFRIYFNFFDDGYMDFPYSINNGGKTIIYDGEEYEVREEIKLMQYTGVKDKNGTEIYEDDIVTWKNDDEDIVKYAKVFFENGAFRLCNSYFELCNYENLEVVGNIYDNPELLGED